MNLTPEHIRTRLQQAHPGAIPGSSPGGGLQAAAVLIPLFLDQNEWHMLLIKRSAQEADRHSSQLAFPGGRSEKQDSTLLDTALRETREEIALQPEDIELLGRVKTITTVTDYHVTPFVGLFPWPYPLQPEPREVDKILSIPLEWLLDPAHSREEIWEAPDDPGRPHPVIFFNSYQGEVLWGASARMVWDLIRILTADEPDRN